MKTTLTTRTALAAAFTTLALTTLTACGANETTASSDSSGDGSGGSTTTSDAGRAIVGSAPDALGGAPEVTAGDSATAMSSTEAPKTMPAAAEPASAEADRSVIRTGEVRLEDTDLTAVRKEIEALLAKHKGFVANEDTINDKSGRTQSSTLTLRVPEDDFDEVMQAFQDIGTLVGASSDAADVTTQVIDVNERIDTLEASLRRLRTFIGEAARTRDLIAIEAEITQREAELQSLKAQQKQLADQSTYGTLTAYLSLPEAAVLKDDPLEGAGFLAGLERGWNALTDVALISVTALGAALPFLVLLAGAAGVLWLFLRRRRNARTPAELPAA